MKQDNNGWIKIESKEDLPPTGTYWTVNINGEIRATIRSNEFFVNDNEYWLNNVTYYQPYVARKPNH